MRSKEKLPIFLRQAIKVMVGVWQGRFISDFFDISGIHEDGCDAMAVGTGRSLAKTLAECAQKNKKLADRRKPCKSWKKKGCSSSNVGRGRTIWPGVAGEPASVSNSLKEAMKSEA